MQPKLFIITLAVAVAISLLNYQRYDSLVKVFKKAYYDQERLHQDA